jgi:hypothetical protein
MKNAEVIRGVSTLIDLIDVLRKAKVNPNFKLNWGYVEEQLACYAEPLREHFGILSERIKK